MAIAAVAGAVPAAWLLGATPWFGIARALLPLVALVAVVAALVAVRRGGGWRPLSAAAIGVALSGIVVAAPLRPGPVERPEGPTVRVVFANLLLDSTDPGAAAALHSLDADIVITTETNGTQFLALQERFGAPVVVGGDDAACSLDGPGRCSALNVWTSLPVHTVRTSELLREARGVAFTAETDAGPLEVVAIHPPAPSPLWWRPGSTTPWQHAALLRRLDRAYPAVEGPDLLIGDLNLTDRQAEFALLADGRTDAMRAGRWAAPTSRTWWGRLLVARIDHVLVGEGWCVDHSDTATVPGSDHRGVVSDLGRCAAD